MAVKTFTDNTALPASDINTFLTNAGLVWIAQGSFTGVTTAAPLAITQVFNSTYDNYRVTFKWQGNGNANVLMRFYTGTNTLNTDANYSGSGYSASGGTLAGISELNQTRAYIGYAFGASTDYSFWTCDFLSPNLTTETGYQHTMNGLNGATWAFSQQYQGYKNSTNQYTGFQIYPDANTLIGSYWIYGYRKS
jgi:hypothetical protein